MYKSLANWNHRASNRCSRHDVPHSALIAKLVFAEESGACRAAARPGFRILDLCLHSQRQRANFIRRHRFHCSPAHQLYNGDVSDRHDVIFLAPIMMIAVTMHCHHVRSRFLSSLVFSSLILSVGNVSSSITVLKL